MNWVDLVFFSVLIYFIGTSRGFVATLLEIVGFGVALFFSYRTYAFFGGLLLIYFSLSRGIAYALGFFIAWFLFETLFFFTVHRIRFIVKLLQATLRNPFNIGLGFLAGALQGAIIFLFFISLVFALPVRGQIKKDVLDSKVGPLFVNLSRSFESGLKETFGGAVTETLNFLTIKPGSQESVDLGFATDTQKLSVDEQSERQMFTFVNSERRAEHVGVLREDPQLQQIARAYAQEMFIHGFFSHVSQVDGSDAAERATRAGIAFTVIGENLAYAPDVYVAHQGLMNSPGHRKNILFSDYGRVGIGVVDGGIFGKMFVQLFAN